VGGAGSERGGPEANSGGAKPELDLPFENMHVEQLYIQIAGNDATLPAGPLTIR
jgi:hypothetical protein